jgi:hypothetical protein
LHRVQEHLDQELRARLLVEASRIEVEHESSGTGVLRLSTAGCNRFAKSLGKEVSDASAQRAARTERQVERAHNTLPSLLVDSSPRQPRIKLVSI